jgi:hypothetical protein
VGGKEEVKERFQPFSLRRWMNAGVKNQRKRHGWGQTRRAPPNILNTRLACLSVRR